MEVFADASASFRAFELAGWEAVPEAYDRAFGSLTAQSIGPLLEAVGAGPGVRLLDVAAGPGYSAAAAAARGADVTAVDFSAAMVETARRLHPAIEFLVGDAEALPFGDGAFDALIMSFGLLHLAAPERAAREAWRVLRPGGRFAFTVWAPPEEAVGFGAVVRAVATHGSAEVDLPGGPPFFRFSDPEESLRLLRGAGFARVSVSQVPQVWRLSSSDELLDHMRLGTVRTAGLLRAQSSAALEVIRQSLHSELAAYQGEDGLILPMPAMLGVGEKA